MSKPPRDFVTIQRSALDRLKAQVKVAEHDLKEVGENYDKLYELHAKANELNARQDRRIMEQDHQLSAILKEIDEWWSNTKMFNGWNKYIAELQERDKRIRAIIESNSGSD